MTRTLLGLTLAAGAYGERGTKLKRYCVTVMDNWTPMREFWTLDGAYNFYRKHRTYANVFKWDGEAWCWMFGARDCDPNAIKSPLAGF